MTRPEDCTSYVGTVPRISWGESVRKPCEACGVPWVLHSPKAEEADHPVCATCGTPLHYVAEYGAPGIGQAWECDNGHFWAKIGGQFHDPAEGRQIGQA